MANSSFRRYTLPDLFAGGDPAPIARGTTKKVRVLVRNNAGNPILVGETLMDLQQAGAGTGDSTQTFEVPAGESEVFVLEPGQAMYASSLGAEAIISVHVSEPFEVSANAL